MVLSPCCSIGKKVICLTPLIEVCKAFFNNPYFAEDLTRINREMKPRQSVSPHTWDGLAPEEKQKSLAAGSLYALYDIFIYEQNDLFQKYTVHGREGNIKSSYYMIDFKNTHKVNCETINTAKDAPLSSKCLQLSIQTRKELRDKISYYYARVPKEDIED